MTRDQAAEFRAQLGEMRLELTHAIDAIAAIDYLPDHEIEKIPVGDRFCRR
jgi:hypothetical protein